MYNVNYFMSNLSIYFNDITYSFLIVIVLISSSVLILSIEYVSNIESNLFLLLISIFQFSMIMFICSNDIILTFIF